MYNVCLLLVSAVGKLDIRLWWLIYFIVCLNEVISGRWISTCSVGCNNCRCCIDTCLILLSCTSEVLAETFLQILKIFYILGQMLLFWCGSLTIPCLLLWIKPWWIFNGRWTFVSSYFRLNTAIMYISHMASRWILHFSSPIYLSFVNSNLNNVGMELSHPNIK